jgi:hypothetical protein
MLPYYRRRKYAFEGLAIEASGKILLARGIHIGLLEGI